MQVILQVVLLSPNSMLLTPYSVFGSDIRPIDVVVTNSKILRHLGSTLPRGLGFNSRGTQAKEKKQR